MSTQPTQSDINAFCTAAQRGQLVDVAEFLATFGDAIVNGIDNVRNTALTWAVWNNHRAVVELLLANGADVNLPEASGYTPLHCAVQANKPELAELLLAHDADIDKRDNNNRTALMFAEQLHRDAVAAVLRIRPGELERQKREKEEQARKLEEFKQAQMDKLKNAKPKGPGFKNKPPHP